MNPPTQPVKESPHSPPPKAEGNLAGLGSYPGERSEGRALSPDFEEFTLSPTTPRAERVPVGEAVKLEHRGTTPQSDDHKSRHHKQFSFRFLATVHRDAICRKLQECGRLDLTKGIGDCHTTQTAKICTGCRRASIYFNRCETMFCPICQPRLARERKEAVEWWTKQIDQPKHVVLTVRNTATITRETVRQFKLNFGKLRRRRSCANWLGGFYSLEVTNEGRGWHLHLHALVNARFIPADILAREWANIVGQDFAIVKVKDARDSNYLAQVCKYAVKGNEMAEWDGPDIAALFDAFHGVRTFGAFGSLFKLRSEFADWIKTLQEKPQACECGCTQFRILDAESLEFEEIERQIASQPRPPPKNPPPTTPRPNLEFRL